MQDRKIKLNKLQQLQIEILNAIEASISDTEFNTLVGIQLENKFIKQEERNNFLKFQVYQNRYAFQCNLLVIHEELIFTTSVLKKNLATTPIEEYFSEIEELMFRVYYKSTENTYNGVGKTFFLFKGQNEKAYDIETLKADYIKLLTNEIKVRELKILDKFCSSPLFSHSLKLNN